MDNEIVYTAVFGKDDKEFICGGHLCAVKKISI